MRIMPFRSIRLIRASDTSIKYPVEHLDPDYQIVPHDEKYDYIDNDPNLSREKKWMQWIEKKCHYSKDDGESDIFPFVGKQSNQGKDRGVYNAAKCIEFILEMIING